jgi:hypothetical protein
MTKGTEERDFPTRRARALFALIEIDDLMERWYDPDAPEMLVLAKELEAIRAKLEFAFRGEMLRWADGLGTPGRGAGRRTDWDRAGGKEAETSAANAKPGIRGVGERRGRPGDFVVVATEKGTNGRGE